MSVVLAGTLKIWVEYSNNRILHQLNHMPVNESVLALEDEDLCGEGHGEEVHDEDDDAGRHEVSEVGRLRVRSFRIFVMTSLSLCMFNLARRILNLITGESKVRAPGCVIPCPSCLVQVHAT